MVTSKLVTFDNPVKAIGKNRKSSQFNPFGTPVSTIAAIFHEIT